MQWTYTVNPIGTYIPLTLPSQFHELLRDDIFIDRRNKTPMEMDAYSVYLALKAIEKRGIGDTHDYRSLIVRNIIKRYFSLDNFWRHGAWTGSSEETHLRFSAAAVRLLTEAWLDGLFVDKTILLEALCKHLEYSETLSMGNWFLHDSIEVLKPPTISVYGPMTLNTVWQSSVNNCLVLNTHLDTIVTALDVVHRVPLAQEEKLKILSRLESGISIGNWVLTRKQTTQWKVFSKLDSFARFFIFNSFRSHHKSAKFFRRQIYKSYFKLRLNVRKNNPFFVFTDGYLERDISLDGTGFEYHLVNIHDILRFMIMQQKVVGLSPQNKEDLLSIVDSAIDYAVTSAYRVHMYAALADNGRSELLCEAMLMRASMQDGFLLPKHWIKAFCKIREHLPATPALMGYDPFVVQEIQKGDVLDATLSQHRLLNGRILEVDVESKACRYI